VIRPAQRSETHFKPLISLTNLTFPGSAGMVWPGIGPGSDDIMTSVICIAGSVAVVVAGYAAMVGLGWLLTQASVD
jgi:hypothetical protein